MNHYIFFKSESSGSIRYSIEDEKETLYTIVIQKITPDTNLSRWRDLIITSDRVSEIGRRTGFADIEAGKKYLLILVSNQDCKYSLKIVLSAHQYPLSTFSEAYSARHQRAEWTSNRHKTAAHFVNFTSAKDAIVLFAGTRTVSIECAASDMPALNPSEVVTVYYRCTSSGRFILDNMEANGNYFIVGKSYRPVENLRLRKEPVLNGEVLQVLPVDERVTIIEEGKTVTVDGITSAWAKVQSRKTGVIGWCFGGYLELSA